MRKLLLFAIVVGGVLACLPAGAVQSGKLPIKIDVSTGFALDSNVNLRSAQHNIQKYQQNGDSGLYKQQATLGYDLPITRDLGVLLQYSYYQDFHFRLSPYDALSHNITVTPTWRLLNFGGQVVGLFNFNYLDIGSDKYKTAYTVNPTYFQMLTQKLMLEAGIKFERAYYYAPITIQQDDRTAHTYGANLGLHYFINDARTAIMSVRFVPMYNVTAGTNFNSSSYLLQLSVQIPVMRDLTTRAYFNFTSAPYWNTWVNSSAPFDPNFLYPKRQDYIVEGGLTATYNIYRGLYGEFQFLATQSASNIDFYNYNRFLVGGMLGWRL